MLHIRERSRNAITNEGQSCVAQPAMPLLAYNAQCAVKAICCIPLLDAVFGEGGYGLDRGGARSRCALRVVSMISLYESTFGSGIDDTPLVSVAELLPAVSNLAIRVLPGSCLGSESLAKLHGHQGLRSLTIDVPDGFQYQHAPADIGHFMDFISLERSATPAIEGFLRRIVTELTLPQLRSVYVRLDGASSVASTAVNDVHEAASVRTQGPVEVVLLAAGKRLI